MAVSRRQKENRLHKYPTSRKSRETGEMEPGIGLDELLEVTGVAGLLIGMLDFRSRRWVCAHSRRPGG